MGKEKRYPTVYLTLVILVALLFLRDAYAMDIDKMEEKLRRHVKVLSQDIGERNFANHDNLKRSAAYIEKVFTGFGYQIRRHCYNLNHKTFTNVIAVKPGRQSSPIFIVGAHYDSVLGSPGADDNASGVAGLLLLADLLSGIDLKNTVQFIAFVNEEPPFFATPDMGSFRYAQEARRKGEDIKAMFCLESIGYYDQGQGSQTYPFGLRFFYPAQADFIAVVGNFFSSGILKRAVGVLKENSQIGVEYLVAPVSLAPAIAFSDHWSFWKMGYKAIMITDTAFYRNPHYHTPSDSWEKLNYNNAAEVIKGMYALILEFAH